MSDDRLPITVGLHPTQIANSLDALVDRWWADHFPGSAIARDTAAWNAAYAAKEALKRLLARAMPEATVEEHVEKE